MYLKMLVIEQSEFENIWLNGKTDGFLSFFFSLMLKKKVNYT